MQGQESGREKREAKAKASVLLSSRPDFSCEFGAHRLKESLGPQEGESVWGARREKGGRQS